MNRAVEEALIIRIILKLNCNITLDFSSTLLKKYFLCNINTMIP